MDLAATLAAGLGPAWASGLNLYAVCAALGILGRTGYLELPGSLSFLEIWWVLAIFGALYVVEFVADKVPWLDSAWDAVHTFVRIPAGALIAALAFSDGGLSAQLGGLIAGGALAAEAHALKAGSRLAANTSPEPASNWILSLSEDAAVVGIVVFALKHPGWFLVFLAVVVVLAAVAIFFVVRILRRVIPVAWRRVVSPDCPVSQAVRNLRRTSGTPRTPFPSETPGPSA